DNAGYSVASIGDFNGDGFDDLVASAIRGDDNGTDAGEAYVIYGSAAGFGTVDGTGRAVIDLTTLSATTGFIIRGAGAGDGFGWTVNSAGDVNGDGLADLIVGAPQNGEGKAYLVLGHAGLSGQIGHDGTGRASFDITDPSLSDRVFTIQGDTAGDQAGFWV